MKLRQAELAWPGEDNPGKPKFNLAVNADAAEIMTKELRKIFPGTPFDARQFAALQPCQGFYGRYRVTGKNYDWFVRVSSRVGYPDLEKSVIDHLLSSGLMVNPIVKFQISEHKGKRYRLDVRPFLQGRHFNGSSGDIARVACHLRKVHQVLAKFGQVERIREIARQRYEELARIKEVLALRLATGDFAIFAEHAEWAKEQKGWLQDLTERFDPRLHLAPKAQCIHGEIHPGNVMFSTEEEVVLLDFEESVHHFTSPLWDLAFLVQRFCLRDDPDEGLLRERLAVVAQQYGASWNGLSRVMRLAAWYSVIMLLYYRLDGIVSPRSECEKFVRLECQARTLEHIL
jgi:hypothetical protein